MSLPVIKGHYYATSQSAKLLYQNTHPFAIQLKSEQDRLTWDVCAFRPDPRDNTKFMQEPKCNVTVLYENVEIADKNTAIPRYIIWNDTFFVNVR